MRLRPGRTKRHKKRECTNKNEASNDGGRVNHPSRLKTCACQGGGCDNHFELQEQDPARDVLSARTRCQRMG